MSLPRHHSAINQSLLIAALSLILAMITSPSFAEPRAGHSRTQGESQRNQEDEPRARISAQQAAAVVQQQYGGKVMNVTTYKRNGNIIYGVKILNSGHMRTVNVDGQTGAILN